MWDECKCAVVWAFFLLPFFGIGKKTDLFQSCGHGWVFQICWHVKCSTFKASSFRIWNSSTGITSPPLALFVVMLPKAHLTVHSRMSDSRWVGSLSLLQGIFPTQGSNPGLLHCRKILYQLSHQGSQRILKWVVYPFSSRFSQLRNRTGVSCIAGRFFTNWAIREAP